MRDTRLTGSGLRWIGLGLASVLLILAGSGYAADPSKRFAVTGQAGLGSMRMGDVNDKIADGNAFLEQKGWSTMKALHLGFDFTWDISARVLGGPAPGLENPAPWALSFSAGGDRILGRSRLDFDRVITVKPTATCYHFRAIYQIPYRFNSLVILSVGGGPLYAKTGQLELSYSERKQDVVGFARSESATFKGNGWGAYGFLQAETVLSDKITLVTDVGYRSLTITNSADDLTWGISDIPLPLGDDDGDQIRNEYDLNPSGNAATYLTSSFLDVERDPRSGQIPLDANGRPTVVSRGRLNLDYSGVVVNLGLRFYLF